VLGIGLVTLTPTGNSSPDYSTVAQNGTSSGWQQQTITAAANQQFSELDLLNLSALGVSLYPGPVVKLTGFQQTANACAAAPSATCGTQSYTDSGTISILGGTPVSVQSLLAGTVPVSTLNSALTGVNIPLGATTLAVTGTGITLNSTQPSASSVPSPITINLNVSASLLGVSLLNVQISVTLGSVSASASYS
jgi:hypothetical protein